MQIQFLVVDFVDEIDGTTRKAIVPTNMIKRILEFKTIPIMEKPNVLEKVKSILYFKTNDKEFIEDFRYITQSIEDIIMSKNKGEQCIFY